MSDKPPIPKTKDGRPFPVAERVCVKCGNARAYGPQYHHGAEGSLGEHLRYRCTDCSHLTIEPTKDQDTPERRAALHTAMAAFTASETQKRREWSHEAQRDRDIASVHRAATSRYGWR